MVVAEVATFVVNSVLQLVLYLNIRQLETPTFSFLMERFEVGVLEQRWRGWSAKVPEISTVPEISKVPEISTVPEMSTATKISAVPEKSTEFSGL